MNFEKEWEAAIEFNRKLHKNNMKLFQRSKQILETVDKVLIKGDSHHLGVDGGKHKNIIEHDHQWCWCRKWFSNIDKKTYEEHLYEEINNSISEKTPANQIRR